MQINQFSLSRHHHSSALINKMKQQRVENDECEDYDESSNSGESSSAETTWDQSESPRVVPSQISALPAATSAPSSMLLSMMQSMPFLVFGPQLAAAAAVAAAATSTQQQNAPNHQHHQHQNPSDFSIDSILNTRSQHHHHHRQIQSYQENSRMQTWNFYGAQTSLYPLQQQANHLPSYSYMDNYRKLNEESPHQHFYNWLHNQYESSSSCGGGHQNKRDNRTSQEYKKQQSSTKSATSSPSIGSSMKTSTKSSPTISEPETTISTSSPKIDQQNGHSMLKQQRKTLNRGPRIPFTSAQVQQLEAKFAATQYLSSLEVTQLAKRLNLTDNRVSVDKKPYIIVVISVNCKLIIMRERERERIHKRQLLNQIYASKRS